MIVAFVQARLGSMRLPNKVLATVSGKPMIELLLKRLSQSNEIDKRKRRGMMKRSIEMREESRRKPEEDLW